MDQEVRALRYTYLLDRSPLDPPVKAGESCIIQTKQF